MSNSLRPHGLQPTRLLRPWDFPGKSTGVGCHCLLHASQLTLDKESACNAGDPGSIPGSRRPAGEGIGYPLQYSWASLVAQLVKNQPAMRETWVRSLGWEDPLEKGKAVVSKGKGGLGIFAGPQETQSCNSVDPQRNRRLCSAHTFRGQYF